LLAVLTLLATLSMNTSPAWSANKDMVQLQTQVQALQDQMSRMQQSFDERMGVMKNLMDQNTDNINKVTASIAAMQETLQKQQTSNGTQVEQISGQLQSLNDSLDELKARVNKVSQQLTDMQSAQQSTAANQAAQAAALAAAPPPDVLYQNALRDFNSAKTDLASQEFSDYIKFYPNTDLAGNAYFYLAEIQYKQANYTEAVKNYDQVVQNFPSGNKAASALLKKGYAQVELGQKNDGIATLKHLIQRYPRSNEAVQARDRLRKLGATSAAGED
jgi:tol-pal system protein YbgF